jgi:hypothetical protein
VVNNASAKVAESSAIQSTVLAGLGYGASGGVVSPDSTDYHYGLTPQVLGGVRFIPRDRAAVDLTVRDYYVSRYASTRGGAVNIARADALLSFRFTKHPPASVDTSDLTARRTEATQCSAACCNRADHDRTLPHGLRGIRHFGAVEF